jgi:hypothetical protein
MDKEHQLGNPPGYKEYVPPMEKKKNVSYEFPMQMKDPFNFFGAPKIEEPVSSAESSSVGSNLSKFSKVIKKPANAFDSSDSE